MAINGNTKVEKKKKKSKIIDKVKKKSKKNLLTKRKNGNQTNLKSNRQNDCKEDD
jgi:hypothetical protein